MLPIHSNVRIFLYKQPTDMRKSFDGLSGLVQTALKENPLGGDVYMFINRRRDRIKLLVWDRNGFWLFCKRLEKGTFQLPLCEEDDKITISYDELVMILEGIDLKSIKRRTRYVHTG